MTKANTAIKFNKHNVRHIESNKKARIHYSLDNRIDGRKCVTLYEKDNQRNLHEIFSDAINNSDMMTDYSEASRVVLFEDNPFYQIARETAEKHIS